jgi:hypothetical protein
VSERNTYKHNKHNRISGAIIAMIPHRPVHSLLRHLLSIFVDGYDVSRGHGLGRLAGVGNWKKAESAIREQGQDICLDLIQHRN